MQQISNNFRNLKLGAPVISRSTLCEIIITLHVPESTVNILHATTYKQMADDEPDEEGITEPELDDDADGGEATKDTSNEDESKPDDNEEELEPAVKIEPKLLTLGIMQKCLTMLCKTSSGLHHAFVKFDCRNQEITDISLLENYPHLRYIDVSHNHINSVEPLKSIQQLLLLNCDYNKLTDFQLADAPFVRLLSLAGNQLEACSSLNFPMLEHLILSFNQLTDGYGLQADKLTQLHTLELRGNQLATTKGLRLPSLRNLYIAQNKLERLEDISYNTGLKVLHVRDNRLSDLTGFTSHLVNLEYINLRQNKLAKTSQLRKLQVLPRLAVLALGENPISTEDEYKIEVIAYLPKLTRLDKEDVSEDLRTDAEALAAKKLEEAQEDDEEVAEQQPDAVMGDAGGVEDEED